MNQEWRDIVQEALGQLVKRTNGPVAGAKLRSAVAQIARDRSLEFPPPGIRKFSELVEAFPSDFIVQRHPGSDLLVVPVARAELLAAESPRATSPAARIRQDLFEALTRIPVPAWGLPYYDPTRDTVLYVKDGDEVPAAAVAMPVTTLENEKELRYQFIDEMELMEGAHQSLKDVLEAGHSPLRDFGNAVQEFGLVKRWHAFRVALLATRLREWSVEKAIAWQPSWIDTSESRAVAAQAPLTPVSLDARQQLAEFAAGLTVDDLSRISVPMDIVLRLLAKR